jgi:hypothetical protein
MPNSDSLRDLILRLHDRIRDEVVEACERVAVENLAAVSEEADSDTIYAIDRISESALVDELETWARDHHPLILIAEGVAETGQVLPEGALEEDAPVRVIMDPIDGTRGLMYQKRSGWIVTGVAPNLGPSTGLQDIEMSVMTEIPLVKQHLSDQGWAVRDGGVRWTRQNRITGSSESVHHRPSSAPDIAHGFSTVFRPFPGARDVLAALDDELVKRVLGPQPAGRALCFEDQYASTAGQMFELAAGRDRFIADLRPLVHEIQRQRGEAPSICAHPYDACGYLIATESGVVITGPTGGPLEAPLDTVTPVGWIGYANHEIRRVLEPVLMELLAEFGLMDDRSGPEAAN